MHRLPLSLGGKNESKHDFNSFFREPNAIFSVEAGTYLLVLVIWAQVASPSFECLLLEHLWRIGEEDRGGVLFFTAAELDLLLASRSGAQQ